MRRIWTCISCGIMGVAGAFIFVTLIIGIAQVIDSQARYAEQRDWCARHADNEFYARNCR